MSFLELAKTSFEVSLNAVINTTIKCGDSILDGLIKNQIKKIGKVNIPDLYIVLEFVFVTCPHDFEEVLLILFSEDKAVLMRQLLLSSLDEINRAVAKRSYLTFAHQLVIDDRVKNFKSDWLRNTVQKSIEEWRMGTTELGPSTTLKDVNYWLSQGDPNKKHQRIQNLSSREHRRQGGYQSWLVREEKTNKNFVLEAVEEDILQEHKVIGNGLTKEAIREQLESKKLSTLCDCFFNAEEGKKYYWFKYIIPDGYDILCNAYNKRKTEKRFDEQDILNMVSALFRQVELIKECIGVEPVINPYTVILGEGNQVQLINLFFGIPRRLYISVDSNSITDISTSTNSLFSGLLSYELISSKCPKKIYEELQTRTERTPQLISDYLPKNVTVSLHFAWILDRLCYPSSPQNRYNSFNTLRKDIEYFQRFRGHFQDKNLVDLPLEIKYWAEVLDVLNLRVARFLKLPYRTDSMHEDIIQVFGLTAHCMDKALVNAKNNSTSVFKFESTSLELKSGINSGLHEAGHKCDLFATGIRQRMVSISKITGWPIFPWLPLIILSIVAKLELVALARAIGLFEIHNKDEIKGPLVRLIQSRSLRHHITDTPVKRFLTISHTTKIVDLLNLFVEKNFQDIVKADGSDIALLMLVTLALLKNDLELWEKWCICSGLFEDNNLPKSVNHLENVTENSLQIDRLLIKLLGDPLEERFEYGNDLLNLYISCLQNIAKFRKTMKINRKRTCVEQDFHPSFEKVVIKHAGKETKLPYELIIPFPPYYKTIWREEAITVDSVKSGKNNRITSLSLTPTRLKNITGWRYQNPLTRGWNWIKKYSKNFLWKIIAIGLSAGGVVGVILNHTTIGTTVLTFGILLLSPMVAEWYSKGIAQSKIKNREL
jgi:hypothetical protein